MKRISISTVTALLTMTPSLVYADGLIMKLPEDGSWVEYFLEGREDDTGGQGTLRLSSVGSETVDGKKCRWIELEMKLTPEGRDERQRLILKLLIPEKHLTRGESPGTQILRGWFQRTFGEGKAEVKEFDGANAGPLSWVTGALLMGPCEQKTDLDPEKIDYQRGRLECRGIGGTFAYSMNVNGKLYKLPGTVKTHFHGSVPCGTASLEIDTTLPGGDPVLLKFAVNDFGKGSESRLPDYR